MVDRFAVIYLPKNDTTDKNDIVEPIIAEVKPLSSDYLLPLMEERWMLAREYVDEVEKRQTSDEPLARNYRHQPENAHLMFLNKFLAPPQARVQKMWWNKQQGVFDVKLTPHWSADYCDFPNELCDCSEQSTNKIGHWMQDSDQEDYPLVYVPRKDYEEIEPTVKPTPKEVKRRYAT
jgi:hypothetical protein